MRLHKCTSAKVESLCERHHGTLDWGKKKGSSRHGKKVMKKFEEEVEEKSKIVCR